MRKIIVLGFALGSTLSVLTLGCSSSENALAIAPTIGTGGRVGGVSGSGNTAGSSGAGAGGTAGSSGTAGNAGTGGVVAPPDVQLTSPKSVSDPNTGPVLVGSEVIALCKVAMSSVAGAMDVDTATIKLRMLDAGGIVLNELGGMATGNTNEYSATFSLTDVPAGAVSFECEAADIGSPPQSAKSTHATLLDKGPKITSSKPVATPAYPLSSAVPFDFQVDPVPLSATDTQAGVSDVTLNVAGVDLTSVLVDQGGGHYTASIDFSNPLYFPTPPPAASQATISATNKRTNPGPVLATAPVFFGIDGDGPIITVSSPKDTTVVGGLVQLLFTVTDAVSGVDEKSVEVDLDLATNFFDTTKPTWGRNGNTFSFTFDSKQVVGSAVQLHIDFHARDLATNESKGASLLLYIDNQAPLVDLDPGMVRELRIKPDNCSLPFDPVGPFAVNDQAIASRYSTYRAIIWDVTNAPPGPPDPSQVLYYATVDPATPVMYIQPDLNTPLLIDTDGDNICDDLQTKNLTQQALTQLSPAGTAWYPTTADPACTTFTTTSSPPNLLCNNNLTVDMTRLIRHQGPGNNEGVIYAVSPIGTQCIGIPLEIPTTVAQDGQWVCIAAKAYDKVKNRGISPPLRVCISDSDAGAACAGPLPTCTDGCTPPPGFAHGVGANYYTAVDQ